MGYVPNVASDTHVHAQDDIRHGTRSHHQYRWSTPSGYEKYRCLFIVLEMLSNALLFVFVRHCTVHCQWNITFSFADYALYQIITASAFRAIGKEKPACLTGKKNAGG